MPGGAEPPWEVQEWWKGRGSPRWLPAAGVSAPGAAARGLGEVFASRPSACWQQGWGWAGAQSSQPAVARAAEVTRSSCCYGLTSGSRLLNTERPHLAQGRRNKLSFIAGLDALRSLQTPFLMPSKLLSPRQRLFSFFFLAFPRRRHGTHRGPILLLQHPLRRRGRSAAPGGRFLLPAAGSSPTPEPSSPVPCLWLSMRLPRRLSGAVNELLVHNVWGEMGR